MKFEKYKKAQQIITREKNKDIRKRLLTYYKIMSKGKFGEIQKVEDNNQLITILDHINNGYIYYLKSGEIVQAYREFRSAIDISIKKNNKVTACEAIKAILGIYNRFVLKNKENTYTFFLKEHKKYFYDGYEEEINVLLDYRLKLRSSFDGSTHELEKKYQASNKIISGYYKDINTRLFLTNSSYHLKVSQNSDSLNHYINSANRTLTKRSGYFAKENSQALAILRSHYLNKVGLNNEALIELKKNSINESNGFVFRLLNMYKNFGFSEFLKFTNENNDSKKYERLYKESDAYRKDVENRERIFHMVVNTQVIDMKTQVKNTIYYSIYLFIFLSVITFLLLKNSRKKRLLALQQTELETQKNLTLLKEQEISTINAMVEGQEKERKRVAEDLHDNLGSVIATLKLHFDNLRINREKKKIDQETLFDKTEGLIDEAYKKVRSIAHAKNSGVIANQGLLIAIQVMAEKISSAETIQIEVIDYGLEKPIENSLEISLFRIIQELTTNIIKHAQANMATINISQDQDDITILIEDNGIGMETSKIDSKKGMGLHSIKTRVEHLEGSFTIDSTLTKGTTIIINIPT